ncbi:MAG: aldose 1-epimerase family protein, partial [Actinomycetota bacterium]
LSPSGIQHALRHGTAEVVIAEVGATLRSYHDGGHDVVQGFPLSEFPSSARGQVLAPWPNRLADGKYSFGGRDGVVPLDDPEHGCAIHGLVRWRPWSLVASAQNRVTLEVTLLATPAYPFAVVLTMEYHLSRSGLTVTARATNVGDEPCPFAFGVHPYLGFGGDLGVVELQVPASTTLATNDRLLPTGGKRSVEGTAFDFRTPTRLDQTVLDTTYTDLDRDEEGNWTVQLHDRWRGRSARLWADEAFPFLQIYSGDTMSDPALRRTALGVEPMTCAPDGFNSGDGLVVLGPGESWTGRYGIAPGEGDS